MTSTVSVNLLVFFIASFSLLSCTSSILRITMLEWRKATFEPLHHYKVFTQLTLIFIIFPQFLTDVRYCYCYTICSLRPKCSGQYKNNENIAKHNSIPLGSNVVIVKVKTFMYTLHIIFLFASCTCDTFLQDICF